jgi:hypothetical protein
MSVTMPAHNEISIRFLRRDEEGSNAAPFTDDILTVQKITENQVRATYRERCPRSGVLTIDTQLMNYQQLFAYLWRVFWVVGIDEDPFKSAQFNIPGHPCFLISVDALKSSLAALMELLMSVCWAWPGVGRITP